MAAPSRTAQISKLHKVLKKHYKPVAPDPNRTVLEHLLLACCLENAHYQPAEEALAALVHTFFDWNEVRVSTIRELSEVMACLPDPPAGASRVKRVLQHVFEANYAFDLEDLHKSNLGPAVERLNKLDGTTAFSVAYVVQSALGGHSIPLDSGTLQVLRLLDLVSDEDVEACVVPGMERAIPKSKGVEFGSLLHQLGADFAVNPYASTLHEILLQVNPEAKARLPKRRVRKKSQSDGAAPDQAPEAPADKSQEATSQESKDGDDAGTGEGAKSAGRKRKKKAEAGPVDPAQAKQAAKGEQASESAVRKKKAGSEPRKKADSAEAKARGDDSEKAPSAAGLSKRKPR